MCRFSDVILQSSVLIVGRSVQCGRQRKPPHEVETTPMTYETLQQWFLNNREIVTFMCGRGSQKSKKESGDRGCKRFVGYWVYGSPQHLSRKIKTSDFLDGYRRIGHFAWYSNHTMSQWVKLRGEFAAYSFVSQQMALYLCIAV